MLDTRERCLVLGRRRKTVCDCPRTKRVSAKAPHKDGHLITGNYVLPTTAPGGAPEHNCRYHTPRLLFLFFLVSSRLQFLSQVRFLPCYSPAASCCTALFICSVSLLTRFCACSSSFPVNYMLWHVVTRLVFKLVYKLNI